MLTHGNVYSNARDVAHYLGINAEDRVIATLPVFHVFALTVVVNAPLLSGATVLLAPRFSPSEIFALAREQKQRYLLVFLLCIISCTNYLRAILKISRQFV